MTTTAAVRGVLCFRCNAALGQFGDKPKVLRRAARNLERTLSQALVRDSLVDIRTRLAGTPGVPPMEDAWRERLADFGTAS